MTGPATLRRFLDERCGACGEAPFLWFRGAVLTYAQVAAITDGAAAAFAGLGLRRADRVATLLPNGPDLILSWLALAKLGVITAPLNPLLAPAEVDRMVAHLEPRLLLAPAGLAAPLAPLPPGARLLGDVELARVLAARSDLAGVDPPRPEDPLDILMTSGTTGRPKGVVQTHRAYVLTGEAFAHWLGLGRADRLFTCLPFSHINARAYSTMGALASGASLAVEERFSASRWWEWLAGCGATQANAIGAMLGILVKAPPSAADRAHRVRLVYSAPALGEQAHRAFEERFGVRLVIGYGLTESTFGFIHPLQGERRLGSMGLIRSHPDPRFGNEARVVDPDSGADLPDGCVGEIQLRNAATFAGYFRDEAATREAKSAQGWLRTGDLARRDQGWYTFVARRKEIIRRRGENIAPAEVEQALAAHPGVRDSAVVGVASDLGEEDLAAFVVLEPGVLAAGPDAERALRAHAASLLAPYKIPTLWRFVESLPRTATQRVARHLLRP